MLITVSGVTKFSHSYGIGIGPIKYSSEGESNGVFGSARGGTESGGVAASPRRAGCVLAALREPPRFVYETALRRYASGGGSGGGACVAPPAASRDHQTTEHYQYL